MREEEIRSIIDFAIEKEQEAMDFYSGLAEKVRVPALAEELKGLAKMEEGHREALTKLDLNVFSSAQPPHGRNLKIADYVVDAVPHSDMSWEDIINIAMHRELAAMNLYEDLAENVGDEMVKRIFQNLAAEERKHKLYLESIWDEKVMKDN